MALRIRGGVAREFNFGGAEWDPAEGENLNYFPGGRSGDTKIAGNGQLYAESNPYPGKLVIVISLPDDRVNELRDLQDDFYSGYFTTAAGLTYTVYGKISNDGALENDNGTVNLEIKGNVEQQ